MPSTAAIASTLASPAAVSIWAMISTLSFVCPTLAARSPP